MVATHFGKCSWSCYLYGWFSFSFVNLLKWVSLQMDHCTTRASKGKGNRMFQNRLLLSGVKDLGFYWSKHKRHREWVSKWQIALTIPNFHADFVKPPHSEPPTASCREPQSRGHRWALPSDPWRAWDTAGDCVRAAAWTAHIMFQSRASPAGPYEGILPMHYEWEVPEVLQSSHLARISIPITTNMQNK